MDWITIIGFILFGLGLIIVEIIFVPGTTIVGVVGVLCAGYGVFISYDKFGSTTGSVILALTGITALGLIIYAFKSKSWERFSLKGESKSRFNDNRKKLFEVGMKGVTVSSLKPIGKALINEEVIEVKSNTGFMEEKTEIQIEKIESSKIIVKAIN